MAPGFVTGFAGTHVEAPGFVATPDFASAAPGFGVALEPLIGVGFGLLGLLERLLPALLAERELLERERAI